MLNYEKLEKLREELKEIEEKIEVIRQDAINEEKTNGNFKPGVNIKLNKEIKPIYEKLHNNKNEKEEEIYLLIKEMIGNSEPLYDPVEREKEQMKKIGPNNKTIDLLINTILLVEEIEANIQEIHNLKITDSIPLNSVINGISAIKFNCSTLLKGLKPMNKKDVEARIKKAEEERELKLRETEKRDKILGKYAELLK